MLFYTKKSTILVPIVLGLFIALVGYTNCADKSFTVSNETLQRLLSESASIYINNDEAYTNNAVVTLTIENNSADEMYITNTKDCSAGGQWEVYSNSKIWTLGEANLRTKAYIKFREKGSLIESSCTWDSIIHDNLPPTMTVVQAAPAITNSNSLNFQFAAADSLSGIKSFSCKDAKGNSLSSCQETMSLSNVMEGPGSVSVIAEDNAGNVSSPLTQTWLADFTAPKVFINSTPSSISNNMSGMFAFSGTDNFTSLLSFECRVDAGAYTACSSPYNFNLAQGGHTFSVRAKDDAGNISTVASYTWTIDLSVPTVRITSTPAAFSNSSSAPFIFDGSDEGVAISQFDCKMDGGAFVNCSSPNSYSSLANGSHTFQVRGYDGAGNMSAPASYTWIIDTKPPVVHLTSNPAKETNQNVGIFQLIATDNETSIQLVECRVDSNGFAPCNSLSATYTNLIQGNHTFQVRAQDIAGNLSAVVSYTWFIDITPPTLSFIKTPANPTKIALAEFETRVTDNSTSPVALECKLDAGIFAACSTINSLNITTDGMHSFSVRAHDTAGNLSSTLSYSWLLDTEGPAINFTSLPDPNVGILDNPKVAFVATDTYSAVNSVNCGLQGEIVSCPAIHEMVYSNLAAGTYTFIVNAVDTLGNASTNSLQFSVNNNVRQITQNVSVTANNKADIIIVIDNSGSMKKEQENMASRFATFIDQLNSLDWRVAIVTTDMSSDADKKDGRLLKFDKTSLASEAGDVYYIHSGMNRDGAKNAFAKTIQRPPSEGSGQEQGIAASLRAIKRSQETTISASAPNRSFFRNDAVLNVVVVTDANETNKNGTKPENTPQFWYDSVHALWPTKPFSYSSIIVRSGDTVCLSKDGNEGYGSSYEKLSKLTGGVIGTVCASDYGSQLTQMAQAVVNLQKSVNLSCAPLNYNKNGTLLDDVVVTLQSGANLGVASISGQTLTTVSDFPTGTHQINYWCY